MKRIIVAALSVCALMLCQQGYTQPIANLDTSTTNLVTKPRCKNWQPERQLLFGDLHVHTKYSLDASTQGTRTSPADVDLDVFLRMCCLPHLHVGDEWVDRTRPEDYAEVPWWLREDYPELFAVPRQFDSLRLYSIAYDIRDMTMFPPPVPANQLNEHHSLNRLCRTVVGNGHLDHLDTGAVV